LTNCQLLVSLLLPGVVRAHHHAGAGARVVGGGSKSPDNPSYPASETNHQLQVLLLVSLLLPGVALALLP
jgi:hypothetical protein